MIYNCMLQTPAAPQHRKCKQTRHVVPPNFPAALLLHWMVLSSEAAAVVGIHWLSKVNFDLFVSFVNETTRHCKAPPTTQVHFTWLVTMMLSLRHHDVSSQLCTNRKRRRNAKTVRAPFVSQWGAKSLPLLMEDLWKLNNKINNYINNLFRISPCLQICLFFAGNEPRIPQSKSVPSSNLLVYRCSSLYFQSIYISGNVYFTVSDMQTDEHANFAKLGHILPMYKVSTLSP